MDCYSEYKYHNHYQQHYNSSYYSPNNSINPSIRFSGGNVAHGASENPQFYDGFSRHNSSHYHSPYYGQFNQGNYNFDSGNEINGQFYYSNMHQASYYGNHHNSYDSYRAASSSAHRLQYGYHHLPPHIQNPQFYSHYNNSNPDNHRFNRYSTPSNSSSSSIANSNATHQQGGDFHSPSISSTDFSSSHLNGSDVNERYSNEKLMDNEINYGNQNQPFSMGMRSNEKTNERVADAEIPSEPKNHDHDSKSPAFKEHTSSAKSSNSTETKERIEDANKSMKHIPNDGEKSRDKLCLDDSTKRSNLLTRNDRRNDHHRQESMDDTRTNEITPESVKQQQNAVAPVDNSRLPEHLLNYDRSKTKTPIEKLSSSFGYSRNAIHSSNHKQKYHTGGYWHSQNDFYRNWPSSSNERNDRNIPDSHSHTFLSSICYRKQINCDKFKHDNGSTTTTSANKRTKKKSKQNESHSRVVHNENFSRNLRPLPGFLQTFGQTEIGKFSEAFCTSSESPLHYYSTNFESDVDSPQGLDSLDSLEGPISFRQIEHFSKYGSENEFDSPIHSFGEIM